MKIRQILAVVSLCALASSAFADVEKTINGLVPKLAAKKVEDRQASQRELENLVAKAARPGAEPERARLATILANKAIDTTLPQPARVWIVHELELIGGAESVGQLTWVLEDPDAELREGARRALERNPAPAAAACLRNALQDARATAWKIKLITSLGERGDAPSVGLIVSSLRDPQTMSAAAAALGKIASDPAVKELWGAFDRKVPAATGALMTAANQRAARRDPHGAEAIYNRLFTMAPVAQVRAEALIGLAKTGFAGLDKLIPEALASPDAKLQAAAVAVAQAHYGQYASTVLSRLLPGLNATAKICVLRVLDRSAEKQIAALAKDPDEGVRLAASEALKRIGVTASVRPPVKPETKRIQAESKPVPVAPVAPPAPTPPRAPVAPAVPAPTVALAAPPTPAAPVAKPAPAAPARSPEATRSVAPAATPAPAVSTPSSEPAQSVAPPVPTPTVALAAPPAPAAPIAKPAPAAPAPSPEPTPPVVPVTPPAAVAPASPVASAASTSPSAPVAAPAPVVPARSLEPAPSVEPVAPPVPVEPAPTVALAAPPAPAAPVAAPESVVPAPSLEPTPSIAPVAPPAPAVPVTAPAPVAAAPSPVPVPSAAPVATPAPVERFAPVKMSGPSDAALLKSAAEGDPDSRAAAINALAARNETAALPALLQYAGEADETVNWAACNALGRIGTENEIDGLAQLVLVGKGPAVADALAEIASRAKHKSAVTKKLIALALSAPPQPLASLLDTLSALGGSEALAAVSSYTNNSNVEVRDAAIRALSNWPDFAATRPLLAIASDPAARLVHNVLAVQGIVRLVKTSTKESVTARLDAALGAMNAAQRDREKRLALSALGTVPHVKAAEAIKPYLYEPATKLEAGSAGIALANSLLKTQKAAAKDLARVIKMAAISPTITEQAGEILQK